MTEMTDMALVRAWAAQHDANAFQELVVRHSRMVYATCLRILGNRTAAEDVTQECFLALARSGGRIRSTPAAWLHGVATRRALSHIRSEGRRRAREARYAQGLPQACEPTWDELQRIVDECVEDLPQPLRDVVILRFFEGLTCPDVASRLDIAESTIYYRLDKALRQLRDAMAKRGAVLTASVLGGMLLEGNAGAAPSAALGASLGRVALLAGGRASAAATLARMVGELSMGMKLTAVAVLAVVSVLGLRAVDSMNEDASVDAGLVAVAEKGEAGGGAGLVQADEPQSGGVLMASAEGDGGESSQDVNAGEAPPVAAEADEPQEGGLTVRVRHANTDAPAEGLVFQHYRYKGVSPYGGFKAISKEVTDARGEIHIAELVPTYYWFLLEHGELVVLEKDGFEVEKGETEKTVTFTVAPGASVAGRIYDADTGEGIPEVNVIFAGGRQHATSDAEGRYRFGGLKPGKGYFSLGNTGPYINPHGLGSGTEYHYTLAKAEASTGHDIALHKGGGVIRGVVVDGRGAPIEKAVVQAFVWNEAHSDQFAPSTDTDADGRFVLQGMPRNEGSLRIGYWSRERIFPNGRGYWPHVERPLDWDAKERTCVLEDACVAEGRVTDKATGEPVTEFDVAGIEESHLNVERGASAVLPPVWAEAERYQTIRDEDGRFSVNDIKAGVTALFVRAKGYGVARVDVLPVEPGSTLEADVELEPAAIAVCSVTDADGKPVAEADIFEGPKLKESWAHSQVPVARTDKDGICELQLTAGTYTLHASTKNSGIRTKEVTLNEGVNRVDFGCTEGGIVFGQVTYEGRALGDVPVGLDMKTGVAAGQSLCVSTAQGGAYRFTGLHAGTGELYVAPPVASDAEGGSNCAVGVEVEIAEDGVTEADLAIPSLTAGIEGSVTIDGEPVERGDMMAVRLDAAQAVLTPGRIASGAFSLSHVPAGRLVVGVVPRVPGLGVRVFRKEVAARAGQVTQCDFHVRLDEGPSIEGLLSLPDPAAPTRKVRVFEGRVDIGDVAAFETFMRRTATQAYLLAEVDANADGEYAIPGLTPGTCTVVGHGRAADGEEWLATQVVQLSGEGVTVVDLVAE